MMNTANVTATTINAAGTTATIMKTNSQQAALSLQTSGIIPTAIIATNDRLPTTNNVIHNNSINALQNHESANSTSTQPVTAFTIHAPAQSLQALPNNLTISAATSASSVPQTAKIQAMPANTSIIHPATIGLSSSTAAAATPTSVVCTGTTILPVTNQQVTAIPVGVTGPTVLKAQPSVTAIPIAQRFQATNVGSSAALNALYIQHDPHTAAAATASAKNQSVTHSAPNAHHQTLIQTNSVISATVAGPTVTVHQQIPSAHSGNQPLFIQTSNSAASSAILHTNVAPSGAANSVQMSTMNLSTSAAHHQQQQQQPQQPTQPQQPPPSQQPPQPSQQALIQQAGAAQQNNPQFQRLKVEDALSYLDQVKYKFNDQPQVYNDFLDIMKEFKSQSIDTPGVIQRVSNLFRGHPELIVGFNTFLPPGYKIEIHANDQVNVSMPNSTKVVLMPSGSMPTGMATSTIVSGPGVPQQQQPQPSISGSLSRNSSAPSAASSVNLLQSINQTFSNSIQSRDATNSPLVNNAVQSQSRVADSHLNRPSNQLLDGSNNSRTGLISSSNSASTPSIHGTTPPVEFNHAINYVNKIKNRFATQPEVYKQFLDILQSYQKEQKEQRVKDGPNGQKAILSETEVYAKVAKLFQKQEDLLKEFSQFLPDASGGGSSVGGAHSQLNSNLLLATPSHSNSAHNSVSNSTSSNYLSMQPGGQSTASAFSHPNVPLGMDGIGSPYTNSNSALSNTDHSTLIKKTVSLSNSNPPHANRTPNSSNSPNSFPNNMHRVSKRPTANMSSSSFIDQGSEKIQISNKRSKLLHARESGLSETSKYIGELSEYALFDKLRKHLNPYQYENFLKCLVVYNGGVISRTELIQLVTKPIFENYPDLLKRFKDLWNMKDSGAGSQINSLNNAYSFSSVFATNSHYGSSYSNNYQLEGLSHRVAMMKERGTFDNENYVELDFNSCKRYGISYRSLPKNPNGGEKCSGRKNDKICNEVLNDTYVSFPSWSEDSSFVASRKTTFEEYIYRCEDERYELDHVIETNSDTVYLFNTLLEKIHNMTEEEKSNYKLDDCLGGRSEVIHKKAIKRVYGDSAEGIIDSLKAHPVKMLPVVIGRLKAKEEEWRESQKHFNKIWREQLEKYYLKSLDHQGITFKQNDMKVLRTKALMNEIETIHEMRQKEEQEKEAANSESASVTTYQPHMFLVYPDKSMIDIACNLIIHHVKRQTSIHKEDKQKIKQLMRHFIPDLFATQRGELSDDEYEDEEEQMETQEEEPKNESNTDLKKTTEVIKPEIKDEEVKVESNETIQPATMLNSDPDDVYALFFVNDFWYFFFRLHYTLCERLSKMHKHALNIAAEEAAAQQINNNDSPSDKLHLKNTVDIEVDEYFSTLIDMVKQLLDGNLDSVTYEDTLREMYGIHAYIAFTFDKLVQNCVRQLQHIVTDEVAWQCNEMFIGASKCGQAGGSCITAHKRAEEEATYQRNAETLMADEHCFKLFIYKNEGKITIELIGSNDDDEDSPNDGDDEPNSQTSRTLRSTAKSDKFDKWNDIEAYNAMIEERLKENPRFLERIVRNSKKSESTLITESKDSDKDNSDKDNDNEATEKTADDEQMSSEENNSPSAQNSERNSEDKDKSQPEIKHLALEKYKSVILANNQHIYRRNALIKARMKHKKVTLKKFEKFNKLHTTWQEDTVTDELRQMCDSWLLSSDVQARIAPDSVSTSQSEADQAIRDTTSALLTLTESPVVSATSTTDKSSSSGVEEKGNASSSSTTVSAPSSKKMHRVTIDDDSRTPYRSYCKYIFK